MASTNQVKDSPQKFAPRQWVKLLMVYLLIILALFLCAGTLRWWQAWLFTLMVFVAGIGGHIWADRRHPGLLAERDNADKTENVKPWDRLLAPLMALGVAFPPVIVAGLDHRYGWSPQFPIWLIVLGFLLIAAGYAFGAWAIAENNFFSGLVRIQSDRGHVVCDSGPYRIVRHPGYLGNIIAMIGIVLALGSLWTIIPAAFAAIVIIVRTALEDHTLRAELPGYAEYAKWVKYRLIPGVW